MSINIDGKEYELADAWNEDLEGTFVLRPLVKQEPKEKPAYELTMEYDELFKSYHIHLKLSETNHEQAFKTKEAVEALMEYVMGGNPKEFPVSLIDKFEKARHSMRENN